MLILTRRSGESIVIGDGKNKIIITVLSVCNKTARLGISAPKEISVHREEVFERILQAKTVLVAEG